MLAFAKKQRALAEIHRRRGDLNTYTQPLKRSGEMKAFLSTFYSDILFSRELHLACTEFPIVGELYKELVPSQIAHEDFWQRYFYRTQSVDRVMRELDQQRAESWQAVAATANQLLAGRKPQEAVDFPSKEDANNSSSVTTRRISSILKSNIASNEAAHLTSRKRTTEHEEVAAVIEASNKRLQTLNVKLDEDELQEERSLSSTKLVEENSATPTTSRERGSLSKNKLEKSIEASASASSEGYNITATLLSATQNEPFDISKQQDKKEKDGHQNKAPTLLRGWTKENPHSQHDAMPSIQSSREQLALETNSATPKSTNRQPIKGLGLSWGILLGALVVCVLALASAHYEWIRDGMCAPAMPGTTLDSTTPMISVKHSWAHHVVSSCQVLEFTWQPPRLVIKSKAGTIKRTNVDRLRIGVQDLQIETKNGRSETIEAPWKSPRVKQ